MKNFKNTTNGHVFKFTGTFVAENGRTCYKTGEYSGIYEEFVELTDEPAWVEVGFNLRLRWNEGQDCIKFIKSIGGDGNSTVGGWWFFGSKEMIEQLVVYMTEKEYSVDSLHFKS